MWQLNHHTYRQCFVYLDLQCHLQKPEGFHLWLSALDARFCHAELLAQLVKLGHHLSNHFLNINQIVVARQAAMAIFKIQRGGGAVFQEKIEKRRKREEKEKRSKKKEKRGEKAKSPFQI